MKAVASLVRHRLKGLVAWAKACQPNRFLETINGLFQAAKRRTRLPHSPDRHPYRHFLIASKLNFSALIPHA